MTSKSRPASTRSSGYTLIEIVAAAAVVAVGITGAVSLSSSMLLQEEMNWRVAVARNYQENLARTWQLGLTANEAVNLMPSASGNPKLAEVVGPSPTLTALGQVNEDSMGLVEQALSEFTVSTAGVSGSGAANTNAVTVFRPTLR